MHDLPGAPPRPEHRPLRRGGPLNHLGTQIIADMHDCDPAALDEAMRAGERAFGRVDVCVANAGIWPAEALLLHELPEARIREVLEVNLLGAIWTARAFFASLARTGPRADGRGAALIFIGSTAGHFGEKGHVEYAASKAALRGLLLTLKNEIVALDPRGRVNLVEPGWTVTPMAADRISRAAKVLAGRWRLTAAPIRYDVIVVGAGLLPRHERSAWFQDRVGA